MIIQVIFKDQSQYAFNNFQSYFSEEMFFAFCLLLASCFLFLFLNRSIFFLLLLSFNISLLVPECSQIMVGRCLPVDIIFVVVLEHKKKVLKWFSLLLFANIWSANRLPLNRISYLKILQPWQINSEYFPLFLPYRFHFIFACQIFFLCFCFDALFLSTISTVFGLKCRHKYSV